MKQIFKYLLRCALFLAIPLAVLTLIQYPFLPKTNHPDAGMPKYPFIGIYGEEENSIDVVIAGDSEAYCSYSPMEMWKEYGFTSHFCSYDAQRPYDTYSFLKDVLKHQSPSVIVLEAYSLYEDIRLENCLNAEIYDLLPTVKYHDRWIRMSGEDLVKPVEYTYISDTKGFYPSFQTDPASASVMEAYMAPSEETEAISPAAQFYFYRLLRLCRQRDIQLVLINSPAPAIWNTPMHNAIADLAQSSGVPYYDLNLVSEEIGLDFSIHSRDRGDHLNYDGAVLAGQYLGRLLQEEFQLPDHREDPAYASWDDCYPRYQQILETARQDTMYNWSRFYLTEKAS